MRTFPGVYLTAAKHPGVARHLMGLSFGESVQVADANENCGVMQPRGPGRMPTGRWAHKPGALDAHAGRGRAMQDAGGQSINGDAAQQMQAQVARTGVVNREPFPCFGLGGTNTRQNVRNTLAGSFYDYLDAVNGPGGMEIIDRGGNPAPTLPMKPAESITPGAWGKSNAVIPTSGATPLASAPRTCGTGTCAMPNGTSVGTRNIEAPDPFTPTFLPQPNVLDEVGGYRIGGGGMAPNPTQEARGIEVRKPRLTKTGGALIAVALAYIFLKPKKA